MAETVSLTRLRELLSMKTKLGWVIEAGPTFAPIYFCNEWWHGEVSLPRWTTMIESAYFWRSRDGAVAAAEEWALDKLGTHTDVRICEHELSE